MNQLYRTSAPDTLIRHPLDSMTAIFQKASGITHIVADPIPAILEVMANDVMTSAEISSKLSDSYNLEQHVDVEDIVLARLEELRTLGLVKRVSGR